MPPAISISDEDVLLAIDLQADFMPGGALAVESGDEIVPLVRAGSLNRHVQGVQRVPRCGAWRLLTGHRSPFLPGLPG